MYKVSKTIINITNRITSEMFLSKLRVIGSVYSNEMYQNLVWYFWKYENMLMMILMKCTSLWKCSLTFFAISFERKMQLFAKDDKKFSSVHWMTNASFILIVVYILCIQLWRTFCANICITSLQLKFQASIIRLFEFTIRYTFGFSGLKVFYFL